MGRRGSFVRARSERGGSWAMHAAGSIGPNRACAVRKRRMGKLVTMKVLVVGLKGVGVETGEYGAA